MLKKKNVRQGQKKDKKGQKSSTDVLNQMLVTPLIRFLFNIVFLLK